MGASTSSDSTSIRRSRVFCDPEFDAEGAVLGISGHVEIDYRSDQSALGEVSPTFQSVREVVEWAHDHAPEVAVLVRTTVYWEGPGDVPGDAVALDMAVAEAEFQVLRRNGHLG